MCHERSQDKEKSFVRGGAWHGLKLVCGERGERWHKSQRYNCLTLMSAGLLRRTAGRKQLLDRQRKSANPKIGHYTRKQAGPFYGGLPRLPLLPLTEEKKQEIAALVAMHSPSCSVQTDRALA